MLRWWFVWLINTWMTPLRIIFAYAFVWCVDSYCSCMWTPANIVHIWPLDIAVDEFMLGEVTGVEKTPPAALEIADIFPLRHISIHSLWWAVSWRLSSAIVFDVCSIMLCGPMLFANAVSSERFVAARPTAQKSSGWSNHFSLHNHLGSQQPQLCWHSQN